ncbi:hypothetical protein ICN83_05740 [Sphingopyxis granuli]|nr:hypothetical protein ICN83_05740 [Sphingopyxis granuli]
MKMMGRIVGGVLGSAIGRRKNNHPVAGAVIGAGTLFVARRMFPQRYAVLAATAAAAYLTKKWAERAEQRRAAEEAHRIGDRLAREGVVDSYAGIDSAASDGEQLGDALPPALPVETNGQPSVH